MPELPSVPFKINMPSSLRRRLGVAAGESGRSVTAEIIARLEKSFVADEECSNALENIEDLVGRVEKLEERVLSHDKDINPGNYDSY